MKKSVKVLARSYWSERIGGFVLGICMVFFLFSLGYGADFTGNWNGYLSELLRWEYSTDFRCVVSIRIESYRYRDHQIGRGGAS